MYQPVTISSNTCSQTYVAIQIKHSLAHLHNLIPILWLVLILSLIYHRPTKVGIESCRCAIKHALFLNTYVWLHVFELTVTG